MSGRPRGFGGGPLPPVAAVEEVDENESVEGEDDDEDDGDKVVEEEEEEELELGLSLRAKKRWFATAEKPEVRRRRIMTADDFSPLARPASPLPSPNSSVSSSSAAAPVGTGGQRARAAASPEAAASPRPSSPAAGAAAVGWPPVRAFWLNSLCHHSNAAISKKTDGSVVDQGGALEGKGKKKGTVRGRSLFVKVSMEGDPIGRKVDLGAFRSYEGLTSLLVLMFHVPTMALGASSHRDGAAKLLDGSGGFKLAYEDKDGDWMLVGDVPWEMFVDTVKRLRIMRSSDSCVLNGTVQLHSRSAIGLPRSQLRQPVPLQAANPEGEALDGAAASLCLSLPHLQDEARQLIPPRSLGGEGFIFDVLVDIPTDGTAGAGGHWTGGCDHRRTKHPPRLSSSNERTGLIPSKPP